MTTIQLTASQRRLVVRQLGMTTFDREAVSQALQKAWDQVRAFIRQLAAELTAWWKRVQPGLRWLRRLRREGLRRPAPWLSTPARNHARLNRRSARR